MQWFQIKEQSAGKNRLILTWYLYKIFGKNILYLISFLAAFFTFIFSRKVRLYSKKYLKVAENYIGVKPNLLNQFRHIHSYADSLADKILVFCGDFKPDSIIYDSEKDKSQMIKDINNKRGVIFICNHIGNIEVLQAMFSDDSYKYDFMVDIFMSNKQSRIFNDFLKTIKRDFPIKMFPVEDIGLTTGIELKENLDRGDIVFVAGDRLAQDNAAKRIETQMFSRKIYLPKGVFKLAKLMEVPIYFISAVKQRNKYIVYLTKQDDVSEKSLVNQYVKFLEKTVISNPYQFFHFYDFFN